MKKLAILMALLLALTVFPAFPAALAKKEEITYPQTLFDRSKPIEIDIIMDKDAWDHMIATASDEEYSACDLMVNGVLYENVAIRPKGNSSLMSVQSLGSERFSWRIKFDKFEKKRTYDGLDILILNNGFKDPGELREAIAYDMYAFLDADASLYNYAVVSVNGAYFGTYLALEGVDESFAERNYGHDDGNLYKPETINMGGRNNNDDEQAEGDNDGGSFGGSAGGQAQTNENAIPTDDEWAAQAGQEGDGEQTERGESNGASGGGQRPDAAAEGEAQQDGASNGDSNGDSAGGQRPEGDENIQRAEGDSAGGSAGAGGGNNSMMAMALNYVGDELSDYQGIWDSAKFDSNEEDFARALEAIKHVCQGDHITDYLDVDNILKYFAIQTFIYNHDGLTGNVSHNYYLYEENGKLNLIPWDMNESFTVSGNGSDYVNFPIDTPFTVSDLSQRSFFMAMLENEECLAKYHEYLRQLSEDYVLSGGLAETIANIRSLIDDYVKDDPTAFSTYDQYVSAANSLQVAIELRAQSVLGQIEGTIPATREGQSAEPDKLLDTTGADLSGLNSGYGMGVGRNTINNQWR